MRNKQIQTIAIILVAVIALSVGFTLASPWIFIVDENATIKSFVDDYVQFLNLSIKGSDAIGRLIKYEEVINLGCVDASCLSAQSWVYQTSYWTGSAGDSSEVHSINSYYGWAEMGGDSITNIGRYGIRPVIEINASVITKA